MSFQEIPLQIENSHSVFKEAACKENTHNSTEVNLFILSVYLFSFPLNNYYVSYVKHLGKVCNKYFKQFIVHLF